MTNNLYKNFISKFEPLYFEVSNRVPFTGMDETREKDGVPQKEDGRIVADKVPVPFLRVKLHREASHIAHGICRTFFSSDSGKSHGDGRFLANFGE